MPFDRPTLTEIDANSAGRRIVSRLPGTDPLLRRSYIGALIRSMAGGLHELYGFQQWIADQAFPDTAEAAELLRWASIWGLTPVPAGKGRGGDPRRGHGRHGRSGELTVWRSGADVDYQSLAEFVMPAAETGNINVEAVVAAAAGNAPVDVILSLVSPISGLGSQANVSTALAGGADIESDASLRARLLSRIQNPPRGGTSEDYEFWSATAHPDVTRAWARSNTPEGNRAQSPSTS